MPRTQKRKMVGRGVTVVHVPHDEYEATYLPMMGICPHTTQDTP